MSVFSINAIFVVNLNQDAQQEKTSQILERITECTKTHQDAMITIFLQIYSHQSFHTSCNRALLEATLSLLFHATSLNE